ncbi:pathogen-associated molecular patterns-induced protein A70-like [Camellia sinensis]|uniref:pathogen-associated molecular patterns-induced protein A70-like n=1 Tax=Camellia sinensis TaxID=4442 RepID=UPI00103623C8|nr:pathogen-associated molecular patterns-induced protein A70-like [Camellia sinensis]
MEDAEAVVANMWALMASWSTPTVFFCVLNLIVAILFFTSKKPLKTHHNNQHPPPPQSEEANQQQHNHQYPPPQQLVRAPSLLQRLRSFEFSLYRSEEHPDQSQTHIQTRQPDPPQVQAPILDRQVTRSKSDNSGGGEAPRRPPVGKMKKWKSEKVRVEEEEEEERERERETASYGGGGEDEEEGEGEGEGEGVDAQADDFIDRFKKQLKLQRVDSILRYTDMLKRGLGRSQV